MPDLIVTVEFGDGELRETHHSHWPADLPRKPVHRLSVRQAGQSWEINSRAKYAIWHPRGLFPGDPLMVFALTDARPGQLAGDRWKFFGGREPEIDVIDESIGSPTLPPDDLFIPGLFRRRPMPLPWWRRLLAAR